MSVSRERLTRLIFDHLEQRETRVLALVVAIRKQLDRSEGIKGDLAETVSSVLHRLVTLGQLVEADGIYSLPPGISGPN